MLFPGYNKAWAWDIIAGEKAEKTTRKGKIYIIVIAVAGVNNLSDSIQSSFPSFLPRHKRQALDELNARQLYRQRKIAHRLMNVADKQINIKIFPE